MASQIQGFNGVLPDQPVDLVGASKISGNQATGSAAQVISTPVAAQAVQATNDATDLSSLSTTLANAVASAVARSTVRPPLVASIKAQIAAGMYGPDLSSVADAIVRALAAA